MRVRPFGEVEGRAWASLCDLGEHMQARQLDNLNDHEKLRGVTALDGTTKAKIERAALGLYVNQSVDAVTTKQIAAAAGFSEATLYRHYETKDDIGFSIFLSIHQRLGDLVLAAHGAGETLAEQVSALVAVYCDTADDDWQLFSFHLLNMHRYLPLSGKNKRNPVDAAEALVKAAIERGEISEREPGLLAAMSLGIVLQPALHKAYGRYVGMMSPLQEDLSRAVMAVLKS